MIQVLTDFILHSDTYIDVLLQAYGNFFYFLLFAIIFIETGLVLMPFLPGDSLLFISGALAAAGSLNIYLLFLIVTLAAVLGDTVNYWFGHYLGEKVFSKFINREYLEQTKDFFQRYGKKTIILARFVPIIRTFAPFIAGVGKMNYYTFLSYNISGGLAWVAIFVFGGYYFGRISFIKDNLTVFILLIIVVSFIPAILGYFKHRKRKLI